MYSAATPYRSHCEGDDVLVVTLLEDQKPAVLLVTLIPAVNYLVTSLVDINTLSITAGELLLPTPGQLQSDVVGLHVVAGRAVPLYHPAGPPQHQRVKASVSSPSSPLLLTDHIKLPVVCLVVEVDLRAGDTNIDQLGGPVVPGDPVGVNITVRTETPQCEVDLLLFPT